MAPDPWADLPHTRTLGTKDSPRNNRTDRDDLWAAHGWARITLMPHRVWGRRPRATQKLLGPADPQAHPHPTGKGLTVFRQALGGLSTHVSLSVMGPDPAVPRDPSRRQRSLPDPNIYT